MMHSMVHGSHGAVTGTIKERKISKITALMIMYARLTISSLKQDT